MKAPWAANRDKSRARKPALTLVSAHVALVCLVCCLNGLSMGCSSTDVGASNYRCMDDDDCRTGLICHPVRKACEPPAVIVDGGVFWRLSYGSECLCFWLLSADDGHVDMPTGGQTDAGAPSCRDGIPPDVKPMWTVVAPTVVGCEAGSCA